MKKLAVLFILIGIIGMTFTAKDFFSKKTMEKEYQVQARDIKEVIIDSDVADVRVVPTASDEVKVRWKRTRSKSGGKDDLITINESETKLHISVGGNSLFQFNFFKFDFLDNRELEIFLPKRNYALLQIHNEVGNVHLSSIEADQIIARTSVSNIDIEDTHSHMLQATSDVGGVSLKNISGELFAKTNVGNIAIETEEIDQQMNIKSDLGDISMTVFQIPNNVHFLATSEIGHVNIFNQGSHYVSGQADNTVSLTTNVGNIDVKAN